MKKYMLFLFILIIMGAAALLLMKKKYPAEVVERIRLVENNLAGWVQTGEEDTWNLAERMKKYNVNGLSIAVINNYKIDWAKGYGFADVSEKRPVTKATLFQAASISKSLNSLGIMKLVQEKRLDLDTDINNYLVSWKFPYDEKTGNSIITLKHLLSHTAGLTVSGFPGYKRGDKLPTIPQILDGLEPANTKAVRSAIEPGKSLIYSGGGTTISQMILMDVTDQQYDSFMRRNVLIPLGMKNSSFTQPQPASRERRLAAGYKADGSQVTGRYHIYPEQAAAGLWTNPTDLCKYIIETQLSFKGESARVINSEMTKMRLTTVIEDAALGAFVNSRVTGSYKYFNHNGGNEGFSCTAIGCLNEGYGVVIMTNSDNSSIIEEIANSAAKVYKWKDYYLPESKKVVDVDPSVLQKYAGKYDLDGTRVIIKMEGKGLLINVQGDQFWNLYFTSDSDFFMREFRGNLKFLSDDRDMVSGFLVFGRTARKIAE